MSKYFTELLGNTDSRQRVGRAIVEGNLPHALLIGGPDGSGKRSFAKLIAAAVNCENKAIGDVVPCQKCNNCRRIKEESFIDLKFFAKQKDKATIGVDDMRLLKEDAMLSGAESQNKFYIIEDAHCLTVESQNALLNILEEPPSGVTIILLATECDRILTTIKSRVQYIAMTRFSDEEIENYALANIPEARELKSSYPERFQAVIKNSEGVIGKAENLFRGADALKNEEERRKILTLIEAMMPKSSYINLRSAISAMPSKRPELMLILEKAISAVRDLILFKETKNVKTLFFISNEEISEYATSISMKKLLSVYDALIHSHEYCTKNANVGTILSDLESQIKIL